VSKIQTKPVVLHPFTENSPLLAAATKIYCKTWRHDWAMAYDFISRYSTFPGFYGVVAANQCGKAVAMGFGADAFAGNWWFDYIVKELGESHPSLQDAWILVELSVLKRQQNRGLGTFIINHLLQHHFRSRVLLSTQQSNTGARRLYERLGWYCIHEGLIFGPGQEPYVIMCKEMCGEETSETQEEI